MAACTGESSGYDAALTRTVTFPGSTGVGEADRPPGAGAGLPGLTPAAVPAAVGAADAAVGAADAAEADPPTPPSAAHAGTPNITPTHANAAHVDTNADRSRLIGPLQVTLAPMLSGR
jgi:hypothetical protein